MTITYELAIDGMLDYFDSFAAAQAEARRHVGTLDEQNMQITAFAPPLHPKMTWGYLPDSGKWLRLN